MTNTTFSKEDIYYLKRSLKVVSSVYSLDELYYRQLVEYRNLPEAQTFELELKFQIFHEGGKMECDHFVEKCQKMFKGLSYTPISIPHYEGVAITGTVRKEDIITDI